MKIYKVSFKHEPRYAYFKEESGVLYDGYFDITWTLEGTRVYYRESIDALVREFDPGIVTYSILTSSSLEEFKQKYPEEFL